MSSIELTDQEWGQVMNLLAEAPWKVSNPLLMKIGEQLRTQHTAAMNPPQPVHKFDGKEASDERTH